MQTKGTNVEFVDSYTTLHPVRFAGSAKSTAIQQWFSQISSHPAVFFSHNKPANNTFSHNKPAKRTGWEKGNETRYRKM
jgi:hypothetical protein